MGSELSTYLLAKILPICIFWTIMKDFFPVFLVQRWHWRVRAVLVIFPWSFWGILVYTTGFWGHLTSLNEDKVIKVPVLLSSNRILLQVGEYCMRIGYYHNRECFSIYGRKFKDSGLNFLCRIRRKIKSCIPIFVWYYFDIVEAMVLLVLGHMYFWIDGTWEILASNSIRNRIVD